MKSNKLPDVSEIRGLLRIMEDTTRSDQSQIEAHKDEVLETLGIIANYWGDGICDAPIWPGAYLGEEDRPIADVVRDVVRRARLARGWKEGEPWTPETARRRIGGTMGT